MKRKADDESPEDLHHHQELDDPSSSIGLSPPEIGKGDAIADDDIDDNLEDLAMDVFKRMKQVLADSSEGACKPASSTEQDVQQQSEMFMLESIKNFSKKTQL